jgi:hypothetical protein
MARKSGEGLRVEGGTLSLRGLATGKGKVAAVTFSCEGFKWLCIYIM